MRTFKNDYKDLANTTVRWFLMEHKKIDPVRVWWLI